MKKDFVLFNQKLPKLSSNEKKVLGILVEAAKLVEPIYQQQENSKYPSANFYPHGLTKKEIEKAAKGNPETLSPYTIVEEKGGKLIPVPYHIKYAKLLEPVVAKLREAARITDNKAFAKKLLLQAEALVEGNYEKAYASLMGMKPYILDIVIGPVDKYDDKLLHAKAAYQAWVGVLDEEQTKVANKAKEAILTARRESLLPKEKIEFYDRVTIKVEHSVIFSGLIARSMFVGVFMPHNAKLIEKYGAEITLSIPANEYRLENEILPAFHKLFSESFQRSFSTAELRRGSMYLIFLHEVAHAYLTYHSSEKQLQEYYPVISQLASSVTGIKVSGSLLLKEMVSMKEIESIMISLVSRSFFLSNKKTDDPFLPHYIIAGSIILNYLEEEGAIQITKGMVVPNFMKVFVSINKLADTLEKLLVIGTRKDAEVFVKKYSKKLVF